MTYEELILLSRILLGAGIAFFALCLFLFFKLRIPAVIGDFSGITARKAIKQYSADSAGMSNAIYRGSGNLSKKGAGSQKLSSGKSKEKDASGYKTEKIYTAKLAASAEQAPAPVNETALLAAEPVSQGTYGETEVLSYEADFGETEAPAQDVNFGETEVLSQETGIGETAVLSELQEVNAADMPTAHSTMGETTVLSDIEPASFAGSNDEQFESAAEFEVEIDITFVHSNETINI